jgi:hypothetical protein
MNNFFRAIIAGYGAKKLGGGCFGTILVFVLIWVALGQCSLSSRAVPAPETYPADRRACVEAPSLNCSLDYGNEKNFVRLIESARKCAA